MKKLNALLSVVAMSLVMVGCSQKAENIKAVYASPIKYESYSCKQLGNEIVRINDRVNAISGQQDKKSTQDSLAMGVGLVVFWPSLFFLAHSDHKDEIARLKGEYEAVRSVGVQKNCTWAQQTPLK